MIVSGPPPSYSPYASNARYRALGPNDSKNPCWRGWGIPAVLLGSLLLLLGIAMLPIEVSRIIRGSLNRGDRNSYFLYPNYNIDANSANTQIQAFLPDIFQGNSLQYRLDNRGIVPFSATSNQGINNFPIQDKYLWPWSHAALLFMLVTMAAGGLGILSGCRRTYSSVFAFFVLSLFSMLLSIFLIAYYATHVIWQLYHNNNRRKANTASNLDYALGAVMLALSCAVCFFSAIATIFSGASLSLCCGSKASLSDINKRNAPPQAANIGRDQYIGIKPPPQFIPVPVGTVVPQ